MYHERCFRSLVYAVTVYPVSRQEGHSRFTILCHRSPDWVAYQQQLVVHAVALSLAA